MSTKQQNGHPIHLIGVANALGCTTNAVALSPIELSRHGLADVLRSKGVAAVWSQIISPLKDEPRASALADVSERVAEQVERSLAMHAKPVVIGGDHSTALGTWRGVGRALQSKGSLGLLWFDAHLDAHTPSTSPSGNLHGMSVAMLMGHGIEELVRIRGPRIAPENIVIYGARSWEQGEWDRLNEQGVRIYSMEEIRDRGVEETLHEAIARLEKRVDYFGFSIDIDVFDSAEVPYTTTPCPRGLPVEKICQIISEYKNNPKLCALEIVEYIPEKDVQQQGMALIARLIQSAFGPSANQLRAKEFTFGASNYDPLPRVFERGESVWLWDVHGQQVLDMMSAYSAVSFGHCHPRLIKALTQQAQQLTLTSRAVSNDKLPLMLERLCDITGMDKALPVNTGLEAVETALKAARKWGHQVKGIPDNCAEIIACEGNFHGRSTLIVGMSSEEQYKEGFGPFPEGLRRVPFGDAAALERAITDNTAAFLVEPIQGEGGIVVPPAGYLAECKAICERYNVLLIVDEVQTGLGRTGALLACDHDHIRPDGLILGKALGGGMYPVSAFLATNEVMNVFRPGDHGSTFGGNPLGAAIALEALNILEEENLSAQAASLGHYFLHQLRSIDNPLIKEVRGRGLMIGLELETRFINAHSVAERMLQAGLLTKDTHGSVLRFAPPLVISKEELDTALAIIEQVLKTMWQEVIANNEYLGKMFGKQNQSF